DWGQEGDAEGIIHAVGVPGWLGRGGQYHPRRRRAGWFFIIPRVWPESTGLGSFEEALDLVAEILEVIRADAEFEDFLDHGREVGQGANGAERRSLGGTDEAARRGQHQGVFDDAQGHSSGVELGGQQTIRTADRACSSGRLAVSAQDLRKFGHSSYTRFNAESIFMRSGRP